MGATIKRLLMYAAAAIVGVQVVVAAAIAFVLIRRPPAPATWPTPADEVDIATTDDGFLLPLYRFKAKGAPGALRPVILVHGFGSNRHSFIGPDGGGLARYLADAGHDVFVAELRGAGLSEGMNQMDSNRWGYNFDTYVNHDAPAIIDRVAGITGQREVDWVGHSMGAMVGYAMVGRGEPLAGKAHIRRFVSLAGPTVISVPKELSFQLSVAAAWPLAKYGNQDLLRFLSPWLAAKQLPPEIPALGLIQNFDADVLRGLAANASANMGVGVIKQVAGWALSGHFTSADGSIDYLDRLHKSRVPTLFLVGEIDRLCSEASIKLAYDALGTDIKRLAVIGKKTGFNVQYGHSDLLLGRSAATEVYPQIADWLDGTSEAEKPAH